MQRTVFRAANLLDGDSEPRSGTSLVIEGNRVAAIGPDEAIEASPEDRVCDLAGRTLMPGMVQSHFHSCFSDWGAQAPQLGLERPAPLMTLVARQNMETALAHGFTSVVCSSSAYYIDRELARAQLMDLYEGPRILPGSHELMVPGVEGDAESENWYMGLTNHGMVESVSGVPEIERMVRREVQRGAEIVKIAASGGHTLGNAHDIETPTDAEIECAARAAHGLGKKIRAHAASRRAVMLCAKNRFDIIDHADRLDEACIEAMLAGGSTLVPSMLYSARFLAMVDELSAAGESFQWRSSYLRSEEEYARRTREAHEDFENISRMLPIANEAGVPIGVGDDFGVAFIPHGDYIAEFELYVKQIGIPPLDVLRWATKHGAALMGYGDELGTLREGHLADLLVVDGDPLADIRCLGDTANLLAIVKDGEFVKDELGALAH
jgi:imidazolonepropionase-like amidohydrolase